MINVMVLLELCKLTGNKWSAIVCIEEEWWPILGDELMKACTQRLSGLG